MGVDNGRLRRRRASHELSTEDLKLAAMLYMQRDTDQTPEQKVSWLQTWGSSGGNQKVPKRLCAEISRDADVKEFKWPNLSSTMKRRDKDRRSRKFFLTWSRCIAHVSACRQMKQLNKVRQEIRDAAEKKRQEIAESVAAVLRSPRLKCRACQLVLKRQRLRCRLRP